MQWGYFHPLRKSQLDHTFFKLLADTQQWKLLVEMQRNDALNSIVHYVLHVRWPIHNTSYLFDLMCVFVCNIFIVNLNKIYYMYKKKRFVASFRRGSVYMYEILILP